MTFIGDLDSRAGGTSVVASDGVFAAYGIPQTACVEVAYLSRLNAAPVQLSSQLQRRPITALCLGVGVLGESLRCKGPRSAAMDMHEEDAWGGGRQKAGGTGEHAGSA